MEEKKEIITKDDKTNRYIRYNDEMIEVSRDNVWFYSDVTQESSMILNKILTDMAFEHLQWSVGGMLERSQASPIWLHINSYGGSITAALAILDTILRIQESGVPIFTVVEGCACSAATFISCVGAKRYIRRNSYMLVHQLSSVAWGKYNQLEDSHKNDAQFMEHIKSIYKEYTKIPESEIDEILKHDLYWDAKKVKKYGLVDDII